MFDRDIVSSDEFTEMSSDAQNLYFHLGVQADDEGFVSPKGIMRMISAPADSLKLLITKGFVIPFESGVVVITAWNQNNFLNSNRVKPTKYTKEREMLVLTDNKNYEFNIGLVSIEESRVEESSNSSAAIATRTKNPSKFSVLGAEVIKAFESVDPKNKTYYSNKTQRAAADFLIQEYGLDVVLNLIKSLPKINTMKLYLGQITTPYELKERWQKLNNIYEQQKLEAIKNKSNVI